MLCYRPRECWQWNNFVQKICSSSSLRLITLICIDGVVIELRSFRFVHCYYIQNMHFFVIFSPSYYKQIRSARLIPRDDRTRLSKKCKFILATDKSVSDAIALPQQTTYWEKGISRKPFRVDGFYYKFSVYSSIQQCNR